MPPQDSPGMPPQSNAGMPLLGLPGAVLGVPARMARAFKGLLGRMLHLASDSVQEGLKVGALGVVALPLKALAPRWIWTALEVCSVLRLLQRVPNRSKTRLKPRTLTPKSPALASLLRGLDALPLPILAASAYAFIASRSGPTPKTQRPRPPVAKSSFVRKQASLRTPPRPTRPSPRRSPTPLSLSPSPASIPSAPPGRRKFVLTLTEEQRCLVRLARAELASRLEEAADRRLVREESDSELADTASRLSDTEVAHFLRSSKWNVAKSVWKLRRSVEWRTTFTFLDPYEVHREYGSLVFWHATAQDCSLGAGRPCLVLRFGALCTKLDPSDHARFADSLVSLMEFGVHELVGPPDGKVVALVDCSDATDVWKLPLGLLQGLGRSFNANYPDRLAGLCAINVPWALRLFLKLCLQAVSPSTRSRIQLVGSNRAHITRALQDLMGSASVALDGAPCTCALCKASPNLLDHTTPAKGQSPGPLLLQRRHIKFTTVRKEIPGFGVQTFFVPLPSFGRTPHSELPPPPLALERTESGRSLQEGQGWPQQVQTEQPVQDYEPLTECEEEKEAGTADGTAPSAKAQSLSRSARLRMQLARLMSSKETALSAYGGPLPNRGGTLLLLVACSALLLALGLAAVALSLWPGAAMAVRDMIGCTIQDLIVLGQQLQATVSCMAQLST